MFNHRKMIENRYPKRNIEVIGKYLFSKIFNLPNYIYWHFCRQPTMCRNCILMFLFLCFSPYLHNILRCLRSKINVRETLFITLSTCKVNSSQLAKMKKYRILLTCPCHKNYRVEAVGLSLFQVILKKYDFREYVKFWVFS